MRELHTNVWAPNGGFYLLILDPKGERMSTCYISKPEIDPVQGPSPTRFSKLNHNVVSLAISP